MTSDFDGSKKEKAGDSIQEELLDSESMDLPSTRITGGDGSTVTTTTRKESEQRRELMPQENRILFPEEQPSKSHHVICERRHPRRRLTCHLEFSERHGRTRGFSVDYITLVSSLIFH